MLSGTMANDRVWTDSTNWTIRSADEYRAAKQDAWEDYRDEAWGERRVAGWEEYRQGKLLRDWRARCNATGQDAGNERAFGEFAEVEFQRWCEREHARWCDAELEAWSLLYDREHASELARVIR